jgi:hypothetical protein
VGGGAEVGAENGVLRGAWRRQAVPAPGLPQGSCYRWRAALHCAWRRQAVPARGLPQVSSNRRHATLPSAWWRQALPEGGLLQGSRSSSRQCVLHAMSPARAARRCVGRCTATAWRGPGAPSHGWDPGARTPPAAGGACGATHRLATAAEMYMCNALTHIISLGIIRQRARLE